MSALDKFYANKIAVVTGAGSGIGRAIAQRLAQHGARVHCADINAEAAATVAKGLNNAVAHALDVTDAAAVQALADQIFRDEGRVDLLFNNAGIGHAALVLESEIEDWRRILEVNVMGVVHGLHAFLPRMNQQQTTSHIINTASGAGLISLPRMAPYCASKHAVVGLSQSLAAELHNSKVKVTILCPGVINTAIVQNTTMRGETATHQSQTVAFYQKNGASPDQVASDLLTDVRKGKLYCLTPRAEVGVGWLAHRLSPKFAMRLIRAQSNKIMGTR